MVVLEHRCHSRILLQHRIPNQRLDMMLDTTKTNVIVENTVEANYTVPIPGNLLRRIARREQWKRPEAHTPANR